LRHGAVQFVPTTEQAELACRWAEQRRRALEVTLLAYTSIQYSVFNKEYVTNAHNTLLHFTSKQSLQWVDGSWVKGYIYKSVCITDANGLSYYTG